MAVRKKQYYYHHKDVLNDQESAKPRFCDHPNCQLEADYRAPKSRDSIDQYYWFCLDHVRDYNKAWDYYKDMGPDEIESHIRFDTTWQRPTWPFASGPPNEVQLRHQILNDDFLRDTSQYKPANYRSALLSSTQKQAFDFLNLHPDLSFEKAKRKYRDLVKKYHPDRHQGEESKEEILKKINAAFAIVKAYYNDHMDSSR
jgi:hypothetical protein